MLNNELSWPFALLLKAKVHVANLDISLGSFSDDPLYPLLLRHLINNGEVVLAIWAEAREGECAGRLDCSSAVDLEHNMREVKAMRLSLAFLIFRSVLGKKIKLPRALKVSSIDTLATESMLNTYPFLVVA